MQERQFGPVRFLPGDNDGKYPSCHSIFIDGAGILLDPASNRERLDRLRRDRIVNEIWLTHWHEDHITHLDLFDDLPLKICSADAPPLSDMNLFLDAYGIEKQAYRQYWADIMESQFNFKPRRAAGYLEDGQVMDINGVTIEIIHCPGHTPGHTALFFRDPQVLFMGDYDLTRFGPWYGDRDSSIDETIASIKKLQSVPAKVWLTCHEDGVFENEPGELWSDYIGIIEEREAKLLKLLSTPRSMTEIVNAWIVYRKPREPEAFFAFAEKALMSKHLERLMVSGQVVEVKEGYVRT